MIQSAVRGWRWQLWLSPDSDAPRLLGYGYQPLWEHAEAAAHEFAKVCIDALKRAVQEP